MSDLDELKQILDIIIPRDGEIEGMTAELHDKAVETAKTKINRLIIEAELRGFDKAFDSHDYDGLREYRVALSNNLSKGDGDEANGA